jgi:hypothetical protein
MNYVRQTGHGGSEWKLLRLLCKTTENQSALGNSIAEFCGERQ